jgi:hypothetical protein
MKFSDRRVQEQLARYDNEQLVTLPSSASVKAQALTIEQMETDELENILEAFNLTSEQLLTVERIARHDVHLACAQALRYLCTHKRTRVRYRIARNARGIMGEGLSTATAEQLVKFVEYAVLIVGTHFIDLSHVIPFLGEHAIEAVASAFFVVVGAIIAIVGKKE